jgi:hypothetical protein
VAQGYPPGSRRHGKTILTGYIHLVSEIEHTPKGGAIASTACGARDKPYVWRVGGLRITVIPSLVECPACRETDAYWDKAGELARIEAGRPGRKWNVA